MRSKPIDGRHLGWSDTDRATKPYARFLDPDIAPLPDHIRYALDRGPLPEPLLPTLGDGRRASSVKRPRSRMASRSPPMARSRSRRALTCPA
jgi:hypothetical protein